VKYSTAVPPRCTGPIRSAPPTPSPEGSLPDRQCPARRAAPLPHLKQLEAENARLRQAVADLTLEKVILREAASGNF
jgi:hypothetical protein